MRILFAGTPEIAVPSLETLAAAHNVAAVLTSPDKVSGRGRKITPPPVKVKAQELGLPVLQPERLGAEARKEASRLNCELLVVFAYGRIFGPKFLALFPRGGINMHPSALPLYRGPSPITEVILRGDRRTALTVQRLALEMDAGDILRSRPYPLTGRETTGSLTADIAIEAAKELKEAVDDLEAGRVEGRPQDSSAATYCSLVQKNDGIIDWSKTAEEIDRMVRAYNPWPKTRTFWKGEPLVILEAAPVGVPEQESVGVPEQEPVDVPGKGSVEVPEQEPVSVPGKGSVGVPQTAPVADKKAASALSGAPLPGSGALLPGSGAPLPGSGAPLPGSAVPLPGEVLGVDKLHGILIQTGNGVLGVTRLQPASRKPLDFRSFMNGFSMGAGTLLGEKNES